MYACMISLLNITQIVYLTTQQLFMPLHKADQILCQLYIQNLGKSIFSIKYQVNPLNNCFIIFNSIVDITLSQYIYSMSKTVCIQGIDYQGQNHTWRRVLPKLASSAAIVFIMWSSCFCSSGKTLPIISTTTFVNLLQIPLLRNP